MRNLVGLFIYFISIYFCGLFSAPDYEILLPSFPCLPPCLPAGRAGRSYSPKEFYFVGYSKALVCFPIHLILTVRKISFLWVEHTPRSAVSAILLAPGGPRITRLCSDRFSDTHSVRLPASGGLSGPPLVSSGRPQVSICPTHRDFKNQNQ